MAIQFKQKCMKCKKTYVLASKRTRYVVCYDCYKSEMKDEIKDPEMKAMFDLPEDFYQRNTFLCDIKIKFVRFGQLSEKQIEAFKKVAEEMKEEAKGLNIE